MLVLDLCAGTGGWTDAFLALGFRVIGVDLVRHPSYRGEFVLGDVRSLSAAKFGPVGLVVASPPCEEFSRHDQPWTRRRNPPVPDLSVWRACERIALELGSLLVIENVRGAQRWVGRAVLHRGSRYLWGTGVPALVPVVRERCKQSYSGRDRMGRSRIPSGLAHWVAAVHVGGGE